MTLSEKQKSVASILGIASLVVVVLAIGWSWSVAIAGIACMLVGGLLVAIVGLPAGTFESETTAEEVVPTEMRVKLAQTESLLDAAERSLRANLRFREQMSGELREPLVAVLGSLDDLQDRAESDRNEVLLRDLRRIRKAGDQLLYRLSQIIDLARIEAGTMEVFWETFELAPLISEVEEAIRPLATRNGNQLRIEVIKPVGRITTDRSKLRQIVVELLSNASRYTSNGEVGIRIRHTRRRGEPHLQVEIRDTGPGLDSQAVAELRGGYVTGRRLPDDQMAMGLRITGHMAIMLGAVVDVESAPDEGTTIRMLFPDWVGRSAGAEGAASVKVPTPSARSVLVVDSDPAAIGQVRALLSNSDVSVITALNLRDAAVLLEASTPSRVVIEPEIEGGEGWYLIRRIRRKKQWREIPVIVHTRSEERQRAYDSGANAYFRKPADSQRFLEELYGGALPASTGPQRAVNRTPAPMRAFNKDPDNDE